MEKLLSKAFLLSNVTYSLLNKINITIYFENLIIKLYDHYAFNIHILNFVLIRYYLLYNL